MDPKGNPLSHRMILYQIISATQPKSKVSLTPGISPLHYVYCTF
ncbi:hypothetical protein HMPREF9374_0289 [Desmospora sp. 8437]|nr:hypothetical protein HMPREF9374_0289 [Desmospora sp. 8437]